jgi:hypothetical protein
MQHVYAKDSRPKVNLAISNSPIFMYVIYLQRTEIFHEQEFNETQISHFCRFT